MNRAPVRLVALLVSLSLATGCAGRRLRADATCPAEAGCGRTPGRVERPDIQLGGASETPLTVKGRMLVMRRVFLGSLTPLAVAVSMLATAPVQALQQIEAQVQDRSVVRRRAPEGHRRGALSFVRTELFFGTAKPDGAVTEEEFKTFLDEVITPLFPDGLTVVKADGQFKGADGLTLKEDSYLLILLYPAEGQKASSRNIEVIRREYMRQHRQESVLRVDDPFLVWVSF
jgi:hypothetical protein